MKMIKGICMKLAHFEMVFISAPFFPLHQAVPELRHPIWETDFIECWYWEDMCLAYEGAKPQPNTG